MEVMTYSKARAGLAGAMERVNRKKEVIVITRRGHKPVAMVPIDDLNGKWDETAYLTSTKANKRALERSVKLFQEGKGFEVKWIKGKPVKI